MKGIKWSSIIVAICYILAGILFFFDPNLTKALVCKIMGYGLLLVGIVSIVVYFIKPKEESFLKNDFMNGLLLFTVGFIALVRSNYLIELVYFLCGIIIAVSGYKKLQDCVDSFRLGSNNVVLYLVLAAISIILGLLVALDTSIPTKVLHNIIGAGLTYSGISDLISTIFLSSKMLDYVYREEDDDIDDNEDETTNDETNEVVQEVVEEVKQEQQEIVQENEIPKDN